MRWGSARSVYIFGFYKLRFTGILVALRTTSAQAPNAVGNLIVGMLTFFFFVNFPPRMLVGTGRIAAPFDRQGVGLGRLDGPLLPPGPCALSRDIDSSAPEFKFGVPNLDRPQPGPPGPLQGRHDLAARLSLGRAR
jgi:hypothetical protein